MHIGFLTPEYPHAKTGNSGGLGTSIKNLANGLLASGHEVTVLVYGQKIDDSFEESGLVIHRIKNTKLKGLSRLLTQKKIQKLINTLVSAKGLEVIEAPDWTGITSNIKVKCPIVVRLHGSDTYFCHLDNRKVKTINKIREKRALENADALLSVSRYTATVTRELFGLSREFTVIPNGIDTLVFQPSSVKEAPQSLLYFGTLIRKKGLLELPFIFNEVISRNPNAKLILIGKDATDVATGGDSTWKLMQPLFSSDALENVNYIGPVSYDLMQNHIAAANVCVFPSFAEALPVSWIEAMAMGKAIVASNIGWAPEVIENGTDGFLSDPKDHIDYAQNITTLLADDQLRSRISTAAREKAISRFSARTVVVQNEQFYDSVIRNYKA
ncbi:MAG: glycosyltransferase family 1 protein [Flavobacterium sp.]|uniref:glycosyltransferase family 4 protein n=1 Tax=Flavobacterium sp. TaxID=239 RepID=UPI0012149FE3|nr:glycosyltransferase family 4 protein [Flavobacterium sp.]RZJ66087.1 MAG: glycosyltransferase family 1 protein [Flavobacterium sp.]